MFNFDKIKNPNDVRLIFTDLETGGLDSETNKGDKIIPKGKLGAEHYAILQIAVIITDGNLKEIGEPLNIIIHHTPESLQNRVGEWSKNEFKDTLMLQCPKSKISIEQAEKIILNHLDKNGVKPRDAYLSGNSIRLDKNFLTHQMADFSKSLHYRMLDISTLKIFFGLNYGDEAYLPKKSSHDALEDIRESIMEMKFYSKFLKTDEQYNLDNKPEEVVKKRKSGFKNK